MRLLGLPGMADDTYSVLRGFLGNIGELRQQDDVHVMFGGALPASFTSLLCRLLCAKCLGKFWSLVPWLLKACQVLCCYWVAHILLQMTGEGRLFPGSL